MDEVILCMQNIRRSRKNIYTNYYLSYNGTNVIFDILSGDETIIFCIWEKDIYRVFYYSCNLSELVSLLKHTPSGAIIDIIAKEENPDMDWIKDANYNLYNTYARFGQKLLTCQEEIERLAKHPLDAYYNENYGSYATEQDLQQLQFIIEKSFDKKTDHLFTDEQLLELIRKNWVLIEKEDGIIYCVVIFQIEGKKCYYNLTYNKGTADVLFSIEKKIRLNAIKEYDANYIYSWIALSNKKALNRCIVPRDGVYNYIFEKE